MTSRNTGDRRSGDSENPGVTGTGLRQHGAWGTVYGLAGMVLAGVLGGMGVSGCARDVPSESPGAGKTATIHVVSGNGRLAGGEEYEIAEWRSGILPASGIGYADFRGQDGGPTLDLRLQRPDQVGEFACDDAGAASLELRVDGANTYRASAEAPCRVVVERNEGGVIEGRYTATLRHTGNASDEMNVRGSFRATNLSAAPAPAAGAGHGKGRAAAAPADIKAAQGPKLGLR